MMKKTLSLVLTVLVLFGTLFPRTASGDDTKLTITGTVIAIDWDDEGNVTAVAISVISYEEDDEGYFEEVEEYMVMNDQKGSKLLGHVGSEVEATGTINIDEIGNKTITVISYKLIDNQEEEDSDPELQ